MVGNTKITLTPERIEVGIGSTGGITRRQYELLGLRYPMEQGWKRRLLGTEIPLKDYELYLALRNSSKAMITARQNAAELSPARQTPSVSETALIPSMGRAAAEPKLVPWAVPVDTMREKSITIPMSPGMQLKLKWIVENVPQMSMRKIAIAGFAAETERLIALHYKP
ncbi:hypothetical protein NHH88_26950 [Oxalobacteraceae bacterium OTU3CAMAD1]|nr:hypothetical protein NHH88_26950 [Oxalobacteraceae bacterium OTU3CAMAD1]